jgi:hypothetical protein
MAVLPRNRHADITGLKAKLPARQNPEDVRADFVHGFAGAELSIDLK